MGIIKKRGGRSVGGIDSRAIDEARRGDARTRKIEKLIALKGKVNIDLDWKTLRSGWSRDLPRPH
jgi:hypothetical protein